MSDALESTYFEFNNTIWMYPKTVKLMQLAQIATHSHNRHIFYMNADKTNDMQTNKFIKPLSISL